MMLTIKMTVSEMLEKNQHVYADTLYVFVCKKCRVKHPEWERYIKHVKKTKHMGVILQVITDDEMLVLP